MVICNSITIILFISLFYLSDIDWLCIYLVPCGVRRRIIQSVAAEPTWKIHAVSDAGLCLSLEMLIASIS